MNQNKVLNERHLYLDEYSAYLISLDRSDSSIKTYKENVLSFVKWFEESNEIPFTPALVTEVDIRDMRSYLQNVKHLKESTINLRIASLKSYFDFLEEQKLINKNPVKHIKKIKVQSPLTAKSFDDQTYRAIRRLIYRESNPEHICMFEILTKCGIRNSELINIHIRDFEISERKGTLMVRGKGNKIRYVPLHSDVRLAINNWMEIRKNVNVGFDNLFISERKVPYTRSGVWKIFKKYCQKISVTDITVHSFRHYFCRTLLKNGVDVSVIAELAGHASGYVTAQVYTIPKPEELEKAIEKL